MGKGTTRLVRDVKNNGLYDEEKKESEFLKLNAALVSLYANINLRR